MFLVRVAFWLTVVALLMPREPDIGLGVPGADAAERLVQVSTNMAAVPRAMPNCKDYRDACATGLKVVDDLQTAALIGLARVKIEIERQKRERGKL